MATSKGVPVVVVVVVVLAALTQAANPGCPTRQEGMLNVHLVCHTHDDVGWLKTVDQYYYGARTSIQNAGVQYILDSVVEELPKNPARKFIYVESAFFFRWWNEQTQEMRDKVKSLVNAGALEFIGGGWCMNDEAAAHYNAIIDQMTVGLRKLNETFGKPGRPTVAWQIDPFGHSREQASLFAQMGFDGLFFGRLDHEDKRTRWETNTMEMVWQASSNLGEAAWLFTGALPNTYMPPAGFCFDILCEDQPIMDDPRLHDYNVKQKVDAFLKVAKEYSKGYATSDIIMTMGSDFQYQNANAWFKNLDKLISYVNKRQRSGSKVNVFYSTPSCYLSALNEANHTWTTKTDDFFPYSSNNHSFWTGYFTSRPTIKGYVRQTNGILQVVKQVSALLGLGRTASLEQLAEAMGVLQHHDAVSGTEQQHVADDYTQRLTIGTKAALGTLAEALSKLQPAEAITNKNRYETTPYFCPLLNTSSCPFTESASAFIITVYNPIARPITHYVRLPVPGDAAYKITDYKGNAVAAQLVPIPKPVLYMPGRVSSATFELVFRAADIPPLGFLRYHVKRTSSRRAHKQQMSRIHTHTLEGDTPITLDGADEDIAISLDPTTGLLMMMGVVRPGPIEMVPVSQNFFAYPGMAGNNSKEQFRASGAYIFRPNATQPSQIAEKAKVITVQGPLVYEVQQEWGPWVSQVLRSYRGRLNLEMEWLVGPIPVSDGVGLEVVSRIDWPTIDSGNTFYTDANGREMLKRTRDHRSTWQLHNHEPVAGNYYPVNSRLVLTDGSQDAAVLTDRSQGGTSLRSGQMEVMVHRRLLYDDAFGVGEALNETQFGTGLVARGKHFLLHSTFATPACDFACLHRLLGEELLLPPFYAFEETSTSAHVWKESAVNKFSGLALHLPANIHLLTLEPWGDNLLLLRLEHMFEKGESPTHSHATTLSLKGLLADWEIIAAEEMVLSANLPKKDLHRLKWKVESGTDRPTRHRHTNEVHQEGPALGGHRDEDPLTITLNPMEIRTFVLTVKKASTRF